jgi:hypothetical protein
MVLLAVLIFTCRTIFAASGCTSADFQIATPIEAATSGSFPFPAYAAADLNGDNKLDLVATDSASGTVGVLINQGSGNFGNPVRYVVGAKPARVKIADLNGDGIPDLVVANTANDAVSVLFGAGGGLFQQQIIFAIGGWQSDVAIADLNNDGKLDLAIGVFTTNSVAILLGNGAGSFTPGPRFAFRERW